MPVRVLPELDCKEAEFIGHARAGQVLWSRSRGELAGGGAERHDPSAVKGLQREREVWGCNTVICSIPGGHPGFLPKEYVNLLCAQSGPAQRDVLPQGPWHKVRDI